MKYSDETKALLLTTINEIAADPSKYAVSPGNDFTRNRKLGFHDTIMMLLNMEADCIKEELYRYFGRIYTRFQSSAYQRVLFHPRPKVHQPRGSARPKT